MFRVEENERERKIKKIERKIEEEGCSGWWNMKEKERFKKLRER